MKISSLFIAVFLSVMILRAGIGEPVRVDGGLVSGIEGASPEVRAFKGIPFAAPPVGELRWRTPQPAAKWDGVFKADHFGPACMQGSGQPRQGGTPFSEDCLYLNVWTAATAASERRPVMMWIYGGGFRTGNGASPNFFGDELAKKGVVLVTINYRVGLMGSFAHPELTKESGHNASGNYAIMDMVAALQWIHRNIAGFGGDPNNVTIFGQSSGAGAVGFLLSSPLTKGLIHRAICESGGGIQLGSNTNATQAEAEKEGVQFAAKVGAKSLAELRAKPAVDLLKVNWETRHNIDGWVLPTSLDEIYTAGKQNDIPILAGSNSDEGRTVVRTPLSAAVWVEQIRQEYGSLADGYLKLYPAGSEDQAAQSQRNEARDVRAWLARALLRAQNKTGKSKTYHYFFSRNPEGALDPKSEFPTLSTPGAVHGAEIVYVFGHLDAQKRALQPWDRTLSEMMSSYWVNFARTGDPNGKDLPNWPAYDAAKDQLMHFGDKISVEQSPLKKVLDVVEKYWAAPITR